MCGNRGKNSICIIDLREDGRPWRRNTFAWKVGVPQGRRPRGTGGTVPPKFEVGDGPCIGPPIFREVVLSDARESKNRVKKGLIKEFFSEIMVFLVKKGPYTTFNNYSKEA